MMETREAQLAKDRVRNATRAAVNHGPEIAAIGTQGALVYALLDVAQAIREQGPDAKTQALLHIADALVDAVVEGADEDRVKSIAQAFEIERKGFNVDQLNGLGFLKGMQ